MRYGYALTTGTLIAATGAAMMAGTSPTAAQVAQNAPTQMSAVQPPRGAPVSFADLAARLQPAVVNISTKQRVPVRNPLAGTPFGDLFGGGGQPTTREATSLGSGFVVSPDGYIVTNNHVVSGGNPAGSGAVGQITVTFNDRKEYAARLVGRDPTTDIALLKIEGRDFPFVNFGDSSRARVGDWVIAIGNPLGLGGTVTAGIISALHRNIGSGNLDRFIQTDAAINQGNSGGPMFDMNGNVIGINSVIVSPSGGSVGLGFAIPAELARPVVETLKGGSRVRRGYLGVGIQPLDEDIAASLGLAKNRGELITRIEPGSAAANAGLRQGDVITRVNNRDVTPDETLSFIVGTLPVGARVPIEFIRAGNRMNVTAILAERPPEDQLAGSLGNDPGGAPGAPAPSSAALGVQVQALTPPIARQLGLRDGTTGVVIAQVDPSSDAASKGLQRGDVIVSANEVAVRSAADLDAQIAAARRAGRNTILLFVQRGPQIGRYIGIRLK